MRTAIINEKIVASAEELKTVYVYGTNDKEKL